MAPRVTKTESQRLEPQLTAVEQATSYLTQEQPLLAISLLETLPADPEVLTLLGVAHYRAEQYAEAAEHLERAKVGGATDERLLALLQRAHANAEADVARPVPAPSYFEQAKFPAAPGVPDLSDRLGVAAPSESSRQRVLTQIGTAAGVKVGLWLQALTNRFGGEPDTGSPWTTWSEHGFLKSMLMLARRRERLNRQQLFSAYPDNVNTSFFEQRGPIPEYAKFARTADGSYNDLADPMAGAAHTRFGFNTRPWDNPPELGARLMTPNPRTVSRELLARDSGFRPIPFLNLIAAPWIQFMNHDWVSYGEPDHRREPYRIPLDEDDPVRQTLRQTHMLVRPSQRPSSMEAVGLRRWASRRTGS